VFSFHATIYPCPPTAAERVRKRNELEDNLQETITVCSLFVFHIFWAVIAAKLLFGAENKQPLAAFVKRSIRQGYWLPTSSYWSQHVLVHQLPDKTDVLYYLRRHVMIDSCNCSAN